MTPTQTITRAVVIMAKEPVPGRTKTRLHPLLGSEAAADLYRCFLMDTIELAVAAPGADVILAIDPPTSTDFFTDLAPGIPVVPQRGAHLGDRLDSVIDSCLRSGYEHVVAVGSDSPSLPTSFIATAFDELDRTDVDVVLGPTEDGGYYLIGVDRRPGALVTDVTMSTPEVLSETVAVADRLGLTIQLVERWYDIDEPADLRRLKDELARSDTAVAPHTTNLLARLELEPSATACG